MSFADIYREERLISRRSRARKARLLGRIIGFGLTACLVVVVRTDPQVRAIADDLALAAVASVMGPPDPASADVAAAQDAAIEGLGYVPGSAQADTIEQLGLSQQQTSAPGTSSLPKSRVTIRRGTDG
ncbi:hypothetical protein [Sulfitobacter sp. S190]|uniref:hypothetical protein n=1 Tax=Sulfitobacter sp. S190 TaxID=2867022 RepID=UPI0021A3A38A|nr:hypothetical protein [Sulfitobacter sp. S190]UWR23256.1 hypothetical protein K3756_04480 [Sulfitobacter sp. S190]